MPEQKQKTYLEDRERRPSAWIRGVIFDLDGVLIDSESLMHKVYAELAAIHQLPDVEGYLNSVRGMNEKAVAAAFDARYGNWLNHREFQPIFLTALRERLVDLECKRGALELLATLEEKKIPYALATSTTKNFALEKLHAVHLDAARFTTTCFGNEVEHSKPHPEIFQRAASGFQADPNQILVIEDSNNGARAGVKGGFYTLLVPDVDPIQEDVRASVQHVFQDLVELRAWLIGEERIS